MRVQHLASMCETLGLVPITIQREGKKDCIRVHHLCKAERILYGQDEWGQWPVVPQNAKPSGN